MAHQHEGLELENPANEPNYDDLLVLSTTPEKAPDKDEYVTMTFEAGVPKSVNGKEMKVSEIITELNRLGGKHGIGIVDIVENRVVGMKSRGVYETPGGTILMEAHDQLEELVLDRATYEVKKDLGNKFAQIVYEGKWYTPLREAIQAFVDVTQQYVTGEVKFRLYKGISSAPERHLHTHCTANPLQASQQEICMITMTLTDSSTCSDFR